MTGLWCVIHGMGIQKPRCQTVHFGNVSHPRILDTNAVDLTCLSSRIAFGALVVNIDASGTP